MTLTGGAILRQGRENENKIISTYMCMYTYVERKQKKNGEECVCVCVCVCERERERGEENVPCVLESFFISRLL